MFLLTNIHMNKYLVNILILSTFICLSACGGGFFKRSDVKDNPVNVEERVQRNIEEGKGIRFFEKGQGGTFDFASANTLWRASVETLDFVPLVNASYSGGIIITDWFSGNNDETSNIQRDLKITIRFLTNEIRSDALKVIIHERNCNITTNNCSTGLIQSQISDEIKIAILKRAAIFEKKSIAEKIKERRKKVPRGADTNQNYPKTKSKYE